MVWGRNVPDSFHAVIETFLSAVVVVVDCIFLHTMGAPLTRSVIKYNSLSTEN